MSPDALACRGVTSVIGTCSAAPLSRRALGAVLLLLLSVLAQVSMAAVPWARVAAPTIGGQVHLVFPRNETYPPSTLFPIVWAFTGGPDVARIEPDRLQAGIFPLNYNGSWALPFINGDMYDVLDHAVQEQLDEMARSSNVSDPYYVFDARFELPEGQYLFSWDGYLRRLLDCDSNKYSVDMVNLGNRDDLGGREPRETALHFTTKQGAPPLSITGRSPDTCEANKLQSVAWKSSTDDGISDLRCLDDEVVVPEPCRSWPNETTSEKIMATLKDKRCLKDRNAPAALGCVYEEEKKSHSPQNGIKGFPWLALVLMLGISMGFP
ncbi:hypothetical protein QBC39DRAFT_20199 [Podospora conica]|nr:hypothetical protein QBC39DRAFT_20199 [Schizothecium conicum]